MRPMIMGSCIGVYFGIILIEMGASTKQLILLLLKENSISAR